MSEYTVLHARDSLRNPSAFNGFMKLMRDGRFAIQFGWIQGWFPLSDAAVTSFTTDGVSYTHRPS